MVYAPWRGDVIEIAPTTAETGYCESDDGGSTADLHLSTDAKTGFTDDWDRMEHRGLFRFDVSSLGDRTITWASLTLLNIGGYPAEDEFSWAWDLDGVDYTTDGPTAWATATKNWTDAHKYHLNPRPGSFVWELDNLDLLRDGNRICFRLRDMTDGNPMGLTAYWLPPIGPTDAILRVEAGLLSGAGVVSTTSEIAASGTVVPAPGLHYGAGTVTTTATVAAAGTVTHATWSGAGTVATTCALVAAGTVAHATWQGAGVVSTTATVAAAGTVFTTGYQYGTGVVSTTAVIAGVGTVHTVKWLVTLESGRTERCELASGLALRTELASGRALRVELETAWGGELTVREG
jgi:hypothetical protein